MIHDLTACDFQGVADLAKVKAFLTGRESCASLPDYWTAGKSTVGTFQTIFDSPAAHHKFWCDANGDYQAYLWLHPTPIETISGNGNSWRMFMHPGVKTHGLGKAMISTAEAWLSARSELPVETVAYREDLWLSTLLEEHGYARQEVLDVYMHLQLDEPVKEPEEIDGYTIRPLAVPLDVAQRSGAQSDAFAGKSEPDAWSLGNTARFLIWYEGREDLDLVAVTGAGEIAAFAVFLVDQVTRSGELDPVGTRASHQGKGLSKALLLTGLRYLESKGMKQVAVRTGIENLPAIRTYQSVGFKVVDYLDRYAKDSGFRPRR